MPIAGLLSDSVLDYVQPIRQVPALIERGLKAPGLMPEYFCACDPAFQGDEFLLSITQRAAGGRENLSVRASDLRCFVINKLG